MKKVHNLLKCAVVSAILIFLVLPASSFAAMNDYCVTPPFIVGGVNPNLLLMIDNSASMFDLAYTDKGSASRQGAYCYDQTYQSTKADGTQNVYSGYFNSSAIYDYTNNYFETLSSFPTSCGSGTAYSKPGDLYVCIDTSSTPKQVTRFVASGNYLNWLTSSKFDVQKGILTGGKYDAANHDLIAESRGCVGRKFIKEPLTADYVEGGTNTSLRITFGVRGPLHPFNETLPSLGGQTYIDIFLGDYNQQLCQDAITAIEEAHSPSDIRQNVQDCLSYSETTGKYCSLDTGRTIIPSCSRDSDCNVGNCRSKICESGKTGQACNNDRDCYVNYGVCVDVTQSVATNTKVMFNLSMQECWQYYKQGTPPGHDVLSADEKKCSDIYAGLKICDGGANDGKLCSTSSDCPSGVCISGPSAIRAGNPAYVCNINYVGYCNAGSSGNWNTWTQREYTSADDCFQAKYAEFCGAVDVPPVIDPSDVPSETGEFANLPAILSDIGVQAQLGEPIKTLTVKEHLITAPSGLLQEFDSLIRFGAMKFNYFGSVTECPANMPCVKICSVSATVCGSNLDCPTGETCVAAANVDGGKVIHHIQGKCSISAATACFNASDCPADEACIYSAGNHNSGLVKEVDDIPAATWTPFAEGFYDAIGYFANARSGDSYGTYLRLNPDDFDVTKPPSQYRCQKNNVLLITDGMSTADLNSSVTGLVSAYNDGDGRITTSASTCPKFAGSTNLDDLAWLAKHRNIKNFTQTPAASDPELNRKTITTYVVYNGTSTADPGECNPDTLLSETAQNGCGTTAGCYQRAEDPEQLKEALRQAFLMISGRAASGTAASVLATGEGSGANLVQAIFYPETTIGGTTVNWTGSLKNLWYFIDPRLGNSSIREDSVDDKILNLQDDSIIHFWFDQTDNFTKAKLFSDSNGDGVADSSTPTSTVYFENIKSIWESGAQLWTTDPGDRTIYTTTDGHTRAVFETPLSDASPLISLLQAGTNRPLAERIINYVRGTDYNMQFCSSSVATSCSIDSDCPVGEVCTQFRNRTVSISGTSHTLKLGDIINSTPRIASWVPLNTYYDTYRDVTYKEFTETSTYKNRGTVFVGGNDGLLHAFKLGQLALFNEKYKKAQISGTDLGKEQWAYIPKNVLPYLKYLADPGYCHLYYVDATPYLFDASVNPPAGCSGDYSTCAKKADSWKTILIGSMRFGGACKNSTSACTKDINGDGLTNSLDCVRTPVADNGYSSYFALDITEPTNPQVLWEFSNPDLGFSTTGVAVVRLGDKTKNGKWFAVIGSGPTGPIDTTTHQMAGHSDQNLRVFILDLKGPSSGTWTLNTDYWVKDSLIQNAFSGSMINAPIDVDQNNPASPSYYQDDALYFGFVKAENSPLVSTTKWNVGGVLRLLTKDDLNPNNWALNTVIRDVGPVPSAVAKLQNYTTNKLFLFFGTGRYYFKIADQIDDANTGRSLYGVKEPCYSSDGLDNTCTSLVTRSSLGNADSGGVTDEDGWFIDLDTCTNLSGTGVSCTSSSAVFKAERNVTDPLATSIGAVFFTTTKPTADVCEFGGASHLWAIQYDTGGAVSSSKLRGKALMQVSTGSIEEVDLKTAFSGAQSRGGRRSAFVQGVPPAGTPPGIILPAKPLKKVIHIRER